MVFTILVAILDFLNLKCINFFIVLSVIILFIKNINLYKTYMGHTILKS